MINITIPPAALERGTEVVRAWRRAGVKSDNIARAAFLAMLEVWPGMATEFRRDSYMGWDGNLIILPNTQTQENSDE